METNNYLIDVNHLRKNFAGKVAVCDFSMKAKQGEIIGFLGPNGSGKTTTIRMLCGLLKPDSGQGVCLGYNIINQGDIIRGQVGYMTQSFSLYKYLTIHENLKFISHAYNLKNSSENIAKVVEKLGLGQRLRQKADSLSGGWKQRLALAAALLHKPKLLLLDEPTGGVDPEARREFWQLISDIASDQGVTILVSTHYMDEAERCHRIIYLAYGQLIVQGSIDEVIKTSKLNTWQVSGDNLNHLAKQLAHLKGVDHITPFGTYLHISGKDRVLLLNSLRPYLNDLRYRWKGINPTLEDAFISFVSNVKEERFD